MQVLAELVVTMIDQFQSSMRLKQNGFCSFKLNFKDKGCATVKDYTVAKNVKGLLMNFQPESVKTCAGRF